MYASVVRSVSSMRWPSAVGGRISTRPSIAVQRSRTACWRSATDRASPARSAAVAALAFCIGTASATSADFPASR
jgi:hypothetical protein